MIHADYLQFLHSKVLTPPSNGFDVPLESINPALKGFTREIVRWGLRGGRRAIFARFGLHKTATQIEIMRQLRGLVGGEQLITLPLGVRQEFFREVRERFQGDHHIPLRFIRGAPEMDGERCIYITNYETVRDGKLDPSLFTAASLDEASVLRSYGSKTYQEFLTLFEPVPYRFVATATPAPNRYKELIHYAGFLGVMDTGQALTRFFQRDSEKAGNLTLYPHKEREFWLWVNSWALFLQKPSDLGFSDEGYALPPLSVRWHEVKTNLADGGSDRDGQGILFRDNVRGLSAEARERRDSLPARIAGVRELVDRDPLSHRIIWHDLEDERRALEAAIPGIVSVYGSQDLEEREQEIINFSDGKFPHLGAKPIIAGSGCNFQRHCHKAAFVGVNHKFNDFIQAIHRIQRFGQEHEVEIDIFFSEADRETKRDLERKWAEYEQMTERMSEIIREYGLNQVEMCEALTRSIGVERVQVCGDGWWVANNDCVAETQRMSENSVDLIVTSIPFSNHYEYTPSYNDFGHTDGDEHFFAQMDFLTPELLRVLKPGRIACVHTKDRILFGSVTGYGTPTVNPFHAKCIEHYRRHGFAYMGMVTVVTDVVRENNQTYRLGWTENCKDSSKMGVGSPEYVLILRKLPSDRGRAYADDPVTKSKAEYTRARWQTDAHAFWRSSGDRLLTAEELAALPPDVLSRAFTDQSIQQLYDYETHVRIGEELELRGALPATFMSLAPGSWHNEVWTDINRMRTLNGEQSRRGLEFHICPLQFDIVDRCIRRYTNPGDFVFDPFGGLSTVPYRALYLKRRGAACELNPGYFLDGVKYLQAAEREMALPSLLSMMEHEAAA